MKKTLSFSLVTLLLAVAIAWLAFPPPQNIHAQGVKISAMTEDTAPTSDDLIGSVNDPGGTPASRKVAHGNLAKSINLSLAAVGTLPVARGGTGVTTSTGTGAVVLNTSPSLVTPIIGAAVATSLQNSTFTSLGAIGFTPVSGSGLNIMLSGTGDFAVNSTGIYHDTSTGFTGLGTPEPNTLLHLFGPTVNLRVADSSTTGNPKISLQQNTAERAYIQYNNGSDLRIDSDADIQLAPNNTVTMTVASSGNIGIADSTPTSLFTIGAGDLFQVSSTGDIVKIKNIAYTWPADDGDAGEQLQSNGSGVLSWEAAGSGGLTKFTEAESTASPNDTVYVDSLTAAGASTNADAAIVPKGTGALLANIPDSTATGGNKRGTRAVDLQVLRASSTQVASGNYSVVSGGYANTASSQRATVSGGLLNIASGDQSVVCGGDSNVASGYYSIVGGGRQNTVSNYYAASLGGFGNEVSGLGAVSLGGNGASASKYSQVAIASGEFSVNGDAQISNLVARNSTTTATPAELFLDGASVRCTIATDTTWAFTITVVARRTDADNESFAAKYEGCVDNNAGTTALVGTVTETVFGDDSGAVWAVSVAADNANDAVVITATGEAAKTIRWVSRIELTEVSG